MHDKLKGSKFEPKSNHQEELLVSDNSPVKRSLLFGTKIKKRSFLLVLNFLSIRRTEFKPLLSGLGKKGVNFF